MKRILIGILIGMLIGLILGGLFWSKEYVSLYKKYYQRGEAIQLLNERE